MRALCTHSKQRGSLRTLLKPYVQLHDTHTHTHTHTPLQPSYRYLGLVWDSNPSMGAMLSARLTAAQAAWAKLLGLITSLGWKDRATRLLLFDTYVRTTLFGGPVWGMELLRRDGDLAVDSTG